MGAFRGASLDFRAGTCDGAFVAIVGGTRAPKPSDQSGMRDGRTSQWFAPGQMDTRIIAAECDELPVRVIRAGATVDNS